MHKENEPLLKTSNEISPCRVDVFGSCVSRSIFLNGIPDARGCADPRIKINRYFFRHSILSCMTPPPNTTELNADIAKTLSNDSAWTTEYYFKALKEELLKSVLPMIRESDGDYFVFDMYDMFTRHVLYDNTILAPIDTVLFSLDAFQNKNNFSHFFPYDYPIGLWYGYIKLFMDEIVEKYGNEHVILVRLRACHSYISKSNEILPIPPERAGSYSAVPKYNHPARMLENFIIREYTPNVIDFSKYYIGDQNYWDHLQGAHFGKGYYTESFKAMQKIMLDTSPTQQSRYFSQLSFHGISDILKTPISTEQFLILWQQIDSPLQEVTGVPALKRLAHYRDEIIIINRLFISNLYLIAESISYILENDLFTENEKDWLYYQEINRLMPQPYTTIQQQILHDIFPDISVEKDSFLLELCSKHPDCPAFSFKCIWEKFLLLFEKENLCWVTYLQHAEYLNPLHPEVLQYLFYYATATDDASLIEHYRLRLDTLKIKQSDNKK